MATLPNPTNPSQNPTLNAALQDLENNNYTYSSFIYPLDLGTEGFDHFMVFHINETSTTQFQTATANGTFNGPKPVGQATINANNSATGPQGNNAVPGQQTANSQPIQRVATTIVLYMPQEVGTEYHAEWEAEQLGLAADFTEKVLGNAGKSWVDVFKSAGASGMKNAGTALNEFTGLALASAASLATRMAINPHMEVIFNGIGFRQFNFKFRFTPTSEAEAANVDNIIRAFKFYAAPEIKTGTAGRFWIYPAEFDIQYYSNGKENLFLNKISTCALTDIQVNYTGVGQWSAFRPHQQIQGNPPVCTDINLTFKELEIITKQRILDGY